MNFWGTCFLAINHCASVRSHTLQIQAGDLKENLCHQTGILRIFKVNLPVVTIDVKFVNVDF